MEQASPPSGSRRLIARRPCQGGGSASWIVVFWGDLSTGPGAAPRPAVVDALRPAGPRGWGSGFDGQLRIVGTLANWWWARGILGRGWAPATGWLTARLQLSGPPDPLGIRPGLIPIAFPAYLSLPPSLSDWAATTACAFHGVRFGP